MSQSPLEQFNQAKNTELAKLKAKQAKDRSDRNQ
jgi:hypothetical protein